MSIPIYVRPKLFISTVHTFDRPRPFRILWVCLCVCVGGGLTEPLLHLATIENEEILDQRVFMPVKSSATSPGPFKGCDSP